MKMDAQNNEYRCFYLTLRCMLLQPIKLRSLETQEKIIKELQKGANHSCIDVDKLTLQEYY